MIMPTWPLMAIIFKIPYYSRYVYATHEFNYYRNREKDNYMCSFRVVKLGGSSYIPPNGTLQTGVVSAAALPRNALRMIESLKTI